jgi:predicted lipid carrier protein YhbT
MAHEIVIHRADAESAAGVASVVEPPELAADGIDEFLHFLPARSKDESFKTPGGSYHFHTTDVEGEWLVNFHAQGVSVRREHAKADVAVRGPASALELFIYNRGGRDGLEIFGDEDRVAAWSEKIRF